MANFRLPSCFRDCLGSGLLVSCGQCESCHVVLERVYGVVHFLLALRCLSGYLLAEFLEEFAGFCLSPSFPPVGFGLEVSLPLLECCFAFSSPFSDPFLVCLGLPFQDRCKAIEFHGWRLRERRLCSGVIVRLPLLS